MEWIVVCLFVMMLFVWFVVGSFVLCCWIVDDVDVFGVVVFDSVYYL